MNVLYSTGEFPLELLHAEMVATFTRQEAREKEAATSGEGESEETLRRFPFGRPSALTKLESAGYRVGYALAERLSKDSPRMVTELDAMKFICKDFWTGVFAKQVDNLRTNHQGVYVIQDNRFLLLTSFPGSGAAAEAAATFLAFPAGIVRGALANLGLSSTVTASMDAAPAAKFNVTVTQGK